MLFARRDSAQKGSCLNPGTRSRLSPRQWLDSSRIAAPSMVIVRDGGGRPLVLTGGGTCHMSHPDLGTVNIWIWSWAIVRPPSTDCLLEAGRITGDEGSLKVVGRVRKAVNEEACRIRTPRKFRVCNSIENTTIVLPLCVI